MNFEWRSKEASGLPRGGFEEHTLLVAFIMLIIFGVVMVYSASAVYAHRTFGSGYHFLTRQAVFATAGISLLFVMRRVPTAWIKKATYPMLVVTTFLLLAVTLGAGHRVNAATRWIRLGPINIQPAEIAKIAIVLWLAYSLEKKKEKIKSFSVGFLPHVLLSGVLMLLCLVQPDFGSAAMIGLLTFVLLFVAGAKAGYLLGAILGAAPIVYWLITSSAYRMNRVIAWLEPFKHREGAGYQIAESLISFGAGGVSGVGLGDSTQKLFYLPEAHNDFISAIVGEELGLFGLWGMVFVFFYIIAIGFRVAWKADNDYQAYLAIGMTMFVGLQALTNLAVAMGMVPTKGLALPFVSYGGSSLMVNCFAAGIILAVARPSAERAKVEAKADKAPRKKRKSRTRSSENRRRDVTGEMA